MSSIAVGVVMLLLLVGIQAGMRYLTVLRTKKAWEAAQEALRDGNFAAAELALARCVKLMPLWMQPRFLLGAVLAKLGKLTEAEDALKMAMALQPREPNGHIELGIFYVTAADRIDDGVAAFRAALQHDAAAWKRLESEPRLEDFRRTDAFTALRPQVEAG